MDRKLVDSDSVVSAHMEPLGLDGFVRGSSDKTYEVRFAKTRALEATCVCFDSLKTGERCRHGVAFLVSLKQARVQIEPATKPQGTRGSPDAGSQGTSSSGPTSVTTTLLLALRTAEREARDAKETADAEPSCPWAASEDLQ